MTYQIVPVEIKDVEALREIAMETYRDTFGDHITEDELGDYFNKDLALTQLQKEVADRNSQHYFLLVDGEIAGFLKLNEGEAQTEQELEDAFEIQRLYLRKAYHGKGLGKVLFEFALEKAYASGRTWAWLGVWEHNERAKSLYYQYGFEKFSQHEFWTGDQVDIDWLLKKPLK